ncbi:fimbrial protein [Klebsiella michiganensis]
MCKKTLASLFTGALLAVSISSAFATDTGKVTFSGKILPDTCSVDINGDATNGTVTFNDLTATAFNGNDSVGDSQPFSIKLTGCDANVQSMNIKFSGNLVDSNTEILQTTGDAENVGVRVVMDDGTTNVKFDNSDPASSTNKAWSSEAGTEVVFKYTAKVVQVGAVAPTTGDYTADATYTLIYR